MSNILSTSRWSASPWWPLVLWLGLPAALANLSIACWPVLEMRLIDQHAIWIMLTELALSATLMLVTAQMIVGSLMLVFAPEPYWLRLAKYSGIIAWLGGAFIAGIAASGWLQKYFDVWLSQPDWDVHDSHTTLSQIEIISWAAILPIYLECNCPSGLCVLSLDGVCSGSRGKHHKARLETPRCRFST